MIKDLNVDCIVMSKPLVMVDGWTNGRFVLLALSYSAVHGGKGPHAIRKHFALPGRRVVKAQNQTSNFSHHSRNANLFLEIAMRVLFHQRETFAPREE
jgi:hypothetical protein